MQATRDAGSVRVGPLARLNVTRTLPTPIAAQALEKFHAYTGGRANNMTLHTNWARTIEIIHAAEVIRDLLNDPDLQKDDLVVTPGADAWTGEGVRPSSSPSTTTRLHSATGAYGSRSAGGSAWPPSRSPTSSQPARTSCWWATA